MWWSRARIVRVKCVPQSAFTSWAVSSFPAVLDNGKSALSIHFLSCFVFALVLHIEVFGTGNQAGLYDQKYASLTDAIDRFSYAFEFSKKKKSLILLRFESYTHKRNGVTSVLKSLNLSTFNAEHTWTILEHVFPAFTKFWPWKCNQNNKLLRNLWSSCKFNLD